ncbi:MAG: 30S ribosomal protein S8 [Clostridia bacterium]
MVVTDTIADMLTRIRNASTAKHTDVEIPSSNTKMAIAKILLDEGYITAVEEKKDKIQGTIKITLKYGPKGVKVFSGLRRISKPGLRVYSPADQLPKVLNGLGIAIVSTSKGIMTDKNARAQNLGGEVLAYVW